MPQLVASFSYFTIFGKDTIHGTPVTQIHPFIQQGGIDLARRTVLEPFAIEYISNGLFLIRRQASG
jgi:hypothetical protein